MPIVSLRYKPNRDLERLVEGLAQALPNIVASNLTLSERERHDGQVTSDDIIVNVTEGGKFDVNAPDLQLMIDAHDFPERKANLEVREDAIRDGVRQFLIDHHRYHPGIGFVWTLLTTTAFRQL